MWPYAPYPFTHRHEAAQALSRKDTSTETDLRNSIYRARGNAKYLIGVYRVSKGPQYSAVRREVLDALHTCRIECRVAAWALRLKREAQSVVFNGLCIDSPNISLAKTISSQPQAPRARRHP